MNFRQRLKSLLTLLVLVSTIGGVLLFLHYKEEMTRLKPRLEQRQIPILADIKQPEFIVQNETSQNHNIHGDAVKAGNVSNTSKSETLQTILSPVNNLEMIVREKKYEYFTDKFVIDKEPFLSWFNKKNEIHICGDRLKVYGNYFGVARNIVMHPEKQSTNSVKGGEQVKAVLGQTEGQEYFNLNSDFWELSCDTNDTTQQKLSNSGLNWKNNIKIVSTANNASNHVHKYTFGVLRGDYANLHNWMRCIFNVFILMSFFKVQPSEMSILFLDAHPFTPLDKAWDVIYSTPIRVGHLSQPVHYENFIWGVDEKNMPFSEHVDPPIPYLEEFRTFVLDRFDLPTKDVLNCKKLRITFIVRRNAVYHPRNAEGNVGRKVFNEAEVVETLMKAFPGSHVQAALMEALPMKSQLEISSQTDLWIGMHGAGMTHIAFLPKHAAVLELFQKDFKVNRPWFVCFHSITMWRGMHYDSWENTDGNLEMPHDYTIVPTDVIAQKAQKLVEQMCPK
ncbi:hypothetical protein DPMN_169611 [Dreissena polymorpha]|uniref:Glycosyltransferase 61 catalytic domain-containing protein n=1 Tax=Dreissena polymorpha TaxID=45954 RepID=A0A9D4DUZ3_DREPO|nr:hypothetical protein DPMN_169611 [Dreissena polymorpha]